MPNAKFEIFVTYSQIAIFDPTLENPFNDWTPQHVAQGFAWREGSVSFRTLEEAGDFKIEVQINNKLNLKPDTKRAVSVPFRVKSLELVEIASISDSKQIKITQGDYTLVFENGYTNDGDNWCCFSFLKEKTIEAKILVEDEDLSPSLPLLMEAYSAF